MDSNYQQQSWVKRSQMLDKLKAIKILEQKKELEEENESMDTALCEFATIDDADKFLKELEDISAKQISLITIINQVTFTGNTLLHVAAASGSKDITELLAYHFPENLMAKTNFQGDTALHAAARAGKLATAVILVEVAKNWGEFLDKDLLEMKNEKGNIALHEAVCNGHIDVAEYMVSLEPQLAYCKNFEGVENKENTYEGKSALYIAVQNGETDFWESFASYSSRSSFASEIRSKVSCSCCHREKESREGSRVIIMKELQRTSRNWDKVVAEIVKMERKIFPKHESLAQFFDDELKKKNSGLLYVEVNREVVGYVIYSWPSSLFASIIKLAVRENHRKQGHGEALMKAAIEKCRTRKVKRISLHVDPLRTPAISLYNKLGFQVDDLIQGYYSPNRSAFRMYLDFDSD